MPANVTDHEKWKKAKKLAAEQGRAEDWAYVSGIYQKMGGGFTGGDKDVKKSLALPLFVIPGQVPRQTQPAALEALTGMPRPVDMAQERLAFTEPVMRVEGITKGLPMEATRANAFQQFVREQLAKSTNEAEFRTKLFQHLHHDMKEGDPTLRRALVQRSLSFYKSKGKSAQTAITERRVQGFRIQKAEGDRGGRIIGHTSSGKAIYESSRYAHGAAMPRLGGRERKLSEAELTNTLHHGHFSIVSAGRNPEHPDEKHLPEDHPKFKQRHEQLRSDLEKHGFDYTEVEGHYGGKEPSFIVHHKDSKPDEAKSRSFLVHHEHESEHETIRDLGKKYHQDSVVHSKNGKHEMHYVTGKKAGTFHEGEGHAIKPTAQDLYTEVKHPTGNQTRFSLNLDFDHTKPFEQALHKGGGEGSKGGKIIGHTSSGKPIYDNPKHPSHAGFSRGEHDEAASAHLAQLRPGMTSAQAKPHADAADAHLKQAQPHTYGERGRDDTMSSIGHITKAEPRGGRYHRRVTDPDTGKHRYFYNEADYAKRPDAHVSGAEAKRAAAKRVIMDHLGNGEQTVDSLRNLINHVDPATIVDIVKQCVERGELEHDNGVLRKKQMQKGALPVMQSAEMQKQKSKAKAAQLEAAGIKTPVQAAHDAAKLEEKKEAEQSGAPMEKAEGTRGGKIIGHTSSGKPIYASRHGYESAGHTLHDYTGGDEPSFADAGKPWDKTGWTKKDHEEAGAAHRKAQESSSGHGGGSMDNAVTSEHRKLANAHEDAAKLAKSLDADEMEGLHLWLLEKSAPGAAAAGHLYIQRIPKPGGGWTYIYAGKKVATGWSVKPEPKTESPHGVSAWSDKQPPAQAKPVSTMEVGGVQIHKFKPGEEPKQAPEHLDKQGRPSKRQWVDHHPNHPTFAQGGTATKYGIDPKTGIPSDPERAKLHDEIISKHFDHVPSVGPDKKPVAVVTMGGPASGKTTALKHLGFAGRKDFVQVDPDAVKTGEEHLGTKGLPEFHEAAGMGHLADGTPVSAKSGAAVVHDESSHIADRIRDKAVKARKNVIIDGTGKNADKHIQLVQHLKSQGYHVHLVMPHQTAETAKKLNKERAAATGRHVPESIVDEAYSKIPHNFDAVAKHADEATLFNAKDGFPPKKVYSKHADGSETHHDPEFMKDFRAQHGPDKIKKSMEAFTMKKIQKPALKPAVDVSKMIDEAFGKATPHDEGSPLEGMDNPAAHDDTHIEHGIKTGRIPKQGK